MTKMPIKCGNLLKHKKGNEGLKREGKKPRENKN